MTRTEHRVRVPFWVLALAVGCCARLYSGVLIALAARRQTPNSWSGDPVTYTGMTMMWDGTWYRRIAENGYPVVLPHDAAGALQQNEWAFYPLFPGLSRAVMTVTGLGFQQVGGTLALIIGLAATVLVATYLRRFMSEPAALLATAAWACFFASPSLQLAYTESLAVLLLAAFLLLVDDRRWWWACLVALLLGVARPVALPLGVVALAAVVVRLVRRREEPIARPEWLAMAATLVSCGVAGLIWPTVAWWRTGIRSAYTDTMATWRAGDEIVPFVPWVDNFAFFFGDKGPWLLTATVVAYLLLTLGPWAWRLPWTAHAWVVAYPLYLGAVLDPISSTFRYLIPLFPLFAVLVGIRKHWRPWQLATGGALVLAGCVLQVWWVMSFLVFYPPSSWPP